MKSQFIRIIRKKLFVVLPLALVFLLAAFNIAQTPKMVLIEGGTFLMGSDSKETYEDERPPHNETVKTYWISKYETTVAEYKAFCMDTKRDLPPKPEWGWNDKKPIVNVTWKDANDYCKWLSKETGKNYRLPTEAEWEFASKGGKLSKKYKYSGSNNPDEVAWYDEKIVDPKEETTVDEVGAQEVGGLKPNELGIYDMSGNVWEWCSNAYKYYKGSKAKLIAAPGGSGEGSVLRVLRGGSWYYEVGYARVTAREGPFASKVDENYGFRVARDK